MTEVLTERRMSEKIHSTAKNHGMKNEIVMNTQIVSMKETPRRKMIDTKKLKKPH